MCLNIDKRYRVFTCHNAYSIAFFEEGEPFKMFQLREEVFSFYMTAFNLWVNIEALCYTF